MADALACEYIDDREAEALLADLTAELLKLEYSDDATDKADEAVKHRSRRQRQTLFPPDQIPLGRDLPDFSATLPADEALLEITEGS